MVCEEFALYFILIDQVLYKIIRNQITEPIMLALLLLTVTLNLPNKKDRQGILNF